MDGVDGVRFGRSIRAIRRRRRWRQDDLAAAAGVSRAVISRVERGAGDRMTVATLERVAASLGARATLRLDWRGEDLDRLLDAEHAQLVDAVVRLLTGAGWATAAEATFSVFGERGSLDVLAFHVPTSVLLVVEVKTVVPDIGSMLMVLDRKRRLAPKIALERGWRAGTVGRLLVIRDGPTARRHVTALSETFATEFPTRNVAIRRWISAPMGAISGLSFLSSSTPVRVGKRVRPAGGASTRGASPDSSRTSN